MSRGNIDRSLPRLRVYPRSVTRLGLEIEVRPLMVTLICESFNVAGLGGDLRNVIIRS